MYAHCSIRSGNVPISCPDAHCSLNQQGSASQLSRNEVSWHLVKHWWVSQGLLFTSKVRQLVPNDIFPLYLRLQLNTGKPFLSKNLIQWLIGCFYFISEVAINPKLIWCPRPGCETVCTLTEEVSHKKTKKKFFGMLPISRTQRNQAVVCSSCEFAFCSQCKTPWHIDSPCPTLSRLLADPNKKNHEPVIISICWIAAKQVF